MATNFDDIFGAAKGKPSPPPKAKATDTLQGKPDPWAGMATEEKEATIRLNVDIPVSLNDALADKARKLRKPKTELVRELLKWALE